MSSCRSCGAPIIWARTIANGRAMPLDAEPADDGNVELVDAHARDLEANVLGPLEVALARVNGTKLYMPHHATCPQADQWRR